MKRKLYSLLFTGTLVLLSIPSVATAAGKNGAASPFSEAFGQSFPEWIRDFWAWGYTGGPQVQPNGVFFMPIPTGGPNQNWQGRNISVGEMSLTVKPGEKLVLGVLAWLNETYDPAYNIPDDVPWPKANFLPPEGEALVTLDGVELINAGNLSDFYYGPIDFEPPIMYSEPTSYHSIGILSVQGIGVVLKPLTPGTHTLTLYSWDNWQGLYGAGGQGWFNTWHLTVAPPKK